MSDITPVSTLALPVAIPALPAALAAPHPAARALQNDVTQAAGTLRAMQQRGRLQDDEADVAVVAYTAVVCTGVTAATTLQTAADWALQAPNAEVHSIAWARIPGHRDGVSEYCLTMAVSYQDPETGEYTGDTHHAAGPMAHVVVSSTDSEEPAAG
ncbi:hypothetical protein ACIG5E_34270 [Kitasatospora sp. NPDC053057]|uniref:hypothetical protein n=1 Tax=Kitasatospora sp. NPDC053057 TaxID=3364062 RepID=UPI0037C87969